ncbi:MAG: hypothetical protein AVDCRST_MAG73-2140, partial [uncultured Thermomicrobiales bacterium]
DDPTPKPDSPRHPGRGAVPARPDRPLDPPLGLRARVPGLGAAGPRRFGGSGGREPVLRPGRSGADHRLLRPDRRAAGDEPGQALRRTGPDRHRPRQAPLAPRDRHGPGSGRHDADLVERPQRRPVLPRDGRDLGARGTDRPRGLEPARLPLPHRGGRGQGNGERGTGGRGTGGRGTGERGTGERDDV